MTADRTRVHTLKNLDLTTVVDPGRECFRPRDEWRTFDGNPPTGAETEALMSATADDFRAVAADGYTEMEMQQTQASWAEELADLACPYMEGPPERTLAAAVDAMPPSDRARVAELLRLTGLVP